MKELTSKKSYCIIGIIIGMLISAFAIYSLHETPRRYIGMKISKEMKFGGDYYSEQYDATRNVQLNISGGSDAINETMVETYRLIAVFILLFGFAVQCYFWIKYYDCRLQINNENNTAAASPPKVSSAPAKTSSQIQKKPVAPVGISQWKCPECGKMNPNISTICKGCSYKR